MARRLYVADDQQRRRAMAFDGSRADAPRRPTSRRYLDFPAGLADPRGLTSHADRLYVADDSGNELWRSTVADADHHRRHFEKVLDFPSGAHESAGHSVACRPALRSGRLRQRAMAFDGGGADAPRPTSRKFSTSHRGSRVRRASRRMPTGSTVVHPATSPTTSYGVRRRSHGTDHRGPLRESSRLLLRAD